MKKYRFKCHFDRSFFDIKIDEKELKTDDTKLAIYILQKTFLGTTNSELMYQINKMNKKYANINVGVPNYTADCISFIVTAECINENDLCDILRQSLNIGRCRVQGGKNACTLSLFGVFEDDSFKSDLEYVLCDNYTLIELDN